MAPIIRECLRLHLDFSILHTGQHYSYNMDKVFFEQLGLPSVKHNLEVGPGSHAVQTGKMLMGIETVLQNEEPDVVLVEGDTNTALAGGLAAVKLGVKVGHVEAGLRSRDRNMPEEINRIIVDHISNYLFAPTEKSRQNLLAEGLEDGIVFVTGNTIVDSLLHDLEIVRGRNNILKDLDLQENDYFLATIHRQENVESEDRLGGIMEGLKMIQSEFDLDLVYPVHPRARERLKSFGLNSDGIRLIDPLDYFSFIQLQKHARLIVTDSGGVQEEACILRVPCVTARDNTERPESIDVGANVLAGTIPETIVEKSRIMLQKDNGWSNPFGDGTAGRKIVEILRQEIE